MVTSHEISLVLGFLISGLFYWKYRHYASQLEREEMLDTFLDRPGPLSTSGRT